MGIKPLEAEDTEGSDELEGNEDVEAADDVDRADESTDEGRTEAANEGQHKLEELCEESAGEGIR